MDGMSPRRKIPVSFGIRFVEKADVLLNSKAQDAEGPQLTLPN